MVVELTENKDEIIARLDKNIWKSYSLPSEPKVFKAPPREVLTSYRLDAMSRYLLVKHLDLEWGADWAIEHYTKLLYRNTPAFLDGDGKKSSRADYIAHFTGLIQKARSGNFDAEQVVIPISGKTIVDGAHRYRIALYYDIPVYFVDVDGPAQSMDLHGLQKLGMRPVTTEHLLQEYLKVNENTYCAVIFVQSEKKLKNASDIISQNGEFIYDKIVLLNDRCLNFIVLLYGHEPWWQDSKAAEFVKLRLPQRGKVNFLFFKPTACEGSRLVKEQIRKYLAADHLMHANDTHIKTTWIADNVLSRGGLRYLNTAPLQNPQRFKVLHDAYAKIMRSRKGQGDSAIDSGAVLAAHGIRDCNDLDFISAKKKDISFDVNDLDISDHNAEYGNQVSFLRQFLVNPDFHFSWKAVKFLSLETVLFLKIARGEIKDIKDAQRILDLLPKLTFQERFDRLRLTVDAWRENSIPHYIQINAAVIKRILPNPFYKALRVF